jgi:citrate lyase subunit beta/citryl-CoA lyase
MLAAYAEATPPATAQRCTEGEMIDEANRKMAERIARESRSRGRSCVPGP